MALAPLSVEFQSLPPLLTSKVGPSGADSRVGGFVYVLESCGSLQGTLQRTPTGVFNQWFETSFPWAGALGLCGLFRSPFVPPSLSARECGTTRSASHRLEGSASCCLASQLHPCPPCSTIRHLAGSASCRLACPSPPATAVPRVLSAWLLISAPPTSLDECLFFNSLVVGLPYSLIFCQFWLFFVFKLLSFWLCNEAQCVYLHLHLGRKSLSFLK